MRRPLLALALVTGLLAGPIDSAAARTCVEPYFDTPRCAVKPKRIIVGASANVYNIRWATWARPVATGNGIFFAGDSGSPAKIQLRQRRRCNGNLWYTRITVSGPGFTDFSLRWRTPCT